MKVYYARTPTRIDLAGGWTDVPLFASAVPGSVLNVAINLYSHVRIVDAPRTGDPPSGKRVTGDLCDDPISMYSVDYDETEEMPAEHLVHTEELRGSFGLVKAALRRRLVDRGMQILTRCEAPPGSGLGTSASMGVALIGALNGVMGVFETPDVTAETAVALETEELGILSGKQDHYAAALGGVQFMSFRGAEVSCVPLELRQESLADLQRRLVLVYTGQSRLSGDVHRHVVRRFQSGDPEIRGTLAGLASAANDARDALLHDDLDGLGKVVQSNWELQMALHPAVSTVELESLWRVGRASGAIGAKACGAGGGGCLVFVCEDGAEGPVAKALSSAGARVLTCDVSPAGLLAWSREAT